MQLFHPDEFPAFLAAAGLWFTFIFPHEAGHVWVGRSRDLAGTVRLLPWPFADFVPRDGQVIRPLDRAIIALAGPAAAVLFCLVVAATGHALLAPANPRWLDAWAGGIATMEIANVIAGRWVRGSDGWHVRQALAGAAWDGKRVGVKQSAVLIANCCTIPFAAAVGALIFAAWS